MNKLEEIRIELDQIDHAMRELFEKRMLLVQEVKAYKKLHQLPILDLERERNMILHHVSQLKYDDFKDAYISFLTHIMSLSKDAQK
jgi:chorismate mutase/prephenate dehydratase